MARMSSIRAPVFCLCMLSVAMSALPSAGRALFVTTFVQVMFSVLRRILYVASIGMLCMASVLS